MNHLIVDDVHSMNRTPLNQKWHNKRADMYCGPVGDLRQMLPRFKRQPSPGGGKSHIVCVPPSSDETATIVGRVSAQYVLIQHDELLDSMVPILAAEGYDLDSMHGELTTTSFGERMELTVELPTFCVTPPDGFSLACRLRCLNSVDASTPLEAGVEWQRLVCSNGMFDWRGSSFRNVHRFDNVLETVQRQVEKRFEKLPKDRHYFEQLMNTEVSADALRDWLDVVVADSWGRPEAARTYNICLTGIDGCVELDDPTALPHELVVSPINEVPGACPPVRNAYHVGQALSWIAGQSVTLQRRFSRTASVPDLLRHLLN